MKITFTLDTIDKAAEEILSQCQYKTLLFYGEMGAGKTTLIKSLTKALGITQTTGSPTFGIVNIYEGNGRRFTILICTDSKKKKKLSI